MHTELSWQGWTTIAVFFGTIVALIREIRPPYIIMMIGACVLMIFGILTPHQLLEGFSDEIILAIAMLCVVVRAIEVNGLLEICSSRILSNSKKYTSQLASLIFPTMGFSAFVDNTPIVLLMSPIVRKWALALHSSPSKFLIPLSYAAILGGLCTIIGTSTNLIVLGLLKNAKSTLSLGFFELAWIGVPCCIVGGIYMMLCGNWILPSRIDSKSAFSEETSELTAEFLVLPESPLANKRIKDVSGKYFPEQFLLQIERGNTVIDSPARDFLIRANDRLVFSGNIHKIAELHAVPGLQSQADPHFHLDVSSSHFSEVVIAPSSLLAGKSLKAVDFRRGYGASVVAVYRQGKPVQGPVGEIILQAADTLMVLSSEAWYPDEIRTKDFYFIRNSEKLSTFNPKRVGLVILAILGIIIPATFGVSIAFVSTIAAFFLVFTGCVTMRDAQKSILWQILLLIGFAFAFGKALEITGVAAFIAQQLLLVVGSSPYAVIGGILFLTIVGTEFMPNSATALIFFPIAVQVAHLSGFTSPEAIKTVAIAIAVGSSCGFAIPTGYQTHMIVYGSGGYRFSDFIKFGLPLDLLIWVVGTLLIPYLWPM